MITYVALLRGINVGGNKKVPMAVLKKTLEKMGFKNVKTLLASGNVLFDAPETNADALKTSLEKNLKATFAFDIPVLIRTQSHLDDLIAADPFNNIPVDDHTRLYVTFLNDSLDKHPTLPASKEFRVVHAKNGEVLSVLQLDPQHRTPEAMDIIEKTYGKQVTTRNWNTVLKLATPKA